MERLKTKKEAKNRPLNSIGRQKSIRMAEVVMTKVKNAKIEHESCHDDEENKEKENTIAPLPSAPRLRRKNSAPDISKLLAASPSLLSFKKENKFRPPGVAPRGRTGRRSTVHFSAGGLQLPVR